MTKKILLAVGTSAWLLCFFGIPVAAYYAYKPYSPAVEKKVEEYKAVPEPTPTAPITPIPTHTLKPYPVATSKPIKKASVTPLPQTISDYSTDPKSLDPHYQWNEEKKCFDESNFPGVFHEQLGEMVGGVYPEWLSVMQLNNGCRFFFHPTQGQENTFSGERE